MLRDHFKLALKNIRARMSRSILTLLGISIGIMAIISLMALGEGMQEAVTGQLSSLSDTIIVATGGGLLSRLSGGGASTNVNSEYFTERDIASIERIHGVSEVSPQLSSSVMARYNNKNVAVSVIGMDIDSMILRYNTAKFESGDLLNEGDQNKILIGYSIAHESFDTDISLGDRLTLNGQKFFVAGIFAKQGMGGLTSTDNDVVLTSRDFKKLTGQSNISSIIVRVYDVNDVDSIASSIEQAVNENHGSKDFASATTMSSILATIQSVIGIIQMVLVAIASIALVVASIGIMNTMLTSVMERTREIGIMKAIGATNKDVMSIFIIEGMIVSSMGGIFGIILGIFGSQGLSSFLTGFGMGGGSVSVTPIVTITSVVLAVGVSLVVGVLSSLYPAWKAARMSPVEAVRYE
jgi:putative ABC transport system permease protein